MVKVAVLACLVGWVGAVEQIHLSYGDDPTTMTVSWSTSSPAPSTVKYNIFGAVQVSTATGSSERFSETMNATIAKECSVKTPLKCPEALICPDCVTEYLHTATLGPLVSGAQYQYQIDGSSLNYTFRAKNTSHEFGGFTFAVFGDMGASLTNPQGRVAPSVALLTAEAERGTIDGVLHVGDFGYDLWEQGGRVGDSFMRDIEPFAARVPYMVTPGNHEGGTNLFGDLHHYVKRFNMPMKERSSNSFFSFDVGPAHFISFSSEAYFWQLWETEKQFAWLKADLAAVDRTRTPFVITMAHRPMYCSNSDDTDDCTKVDSNMRLGLPALGMRFFAVEELFLEHRVDLAFWAHEHSYERLWPTHNNVVYNGSLEEPYHNPGATVHVVTGAAGCREGHDEYKNGPRGDWSAVRNTAYGYGRLLVANSTHLQWEQVEDVDGTVVDSFWLVKDRAQEVQGSPLDMPPVVDDALIQEQIFARTASCIGKDKRLPTCAQA